jgi:hypothetical protein
MFDIMSNDNKDDNQNFFGLNIETGFLLAIITAGSYFISSMYVNAYYSRFGIYSSILHFSIEDTISRGKFPLLYSLILCIIVMFGMYYHDNKMSWIASSLPFFALAMALILLIIDPSIRVVPTAFWLAIILLVFLFSLLGYYYFKKINAFKILWELNIIGKLLVLLAFLLAFGVSSGVLGQYDAKNYIECDNGKCAHINFTLKDPNMSYINVQNSILITYQEGKYYVTKQEKPAPMNPEIYVIPDDQVLITRMMLVQNWSDPNQVNFLT